MSNQLPRLATGIPGLDTILTGGFVEGASYIIQGQPGAGKTIFANQISFANVAAGRKVLYVTLLAETHDRLFQSLSTLDFFQKERLGNGISYVSVFQTLRSEGLSAVVTLLRQETKRQQAGLLVFDGLLNARDRADTDLDVKTFIAEVQSQAAFVGCTVLFLTSRRFADDSPEHTMIDGVVDLHDELVGVRSVRRLQVRKSRGTAALGGYHQYEIAGNGITVYPRIEAVLARPTGEDDAKSSVVTTGIASLDPLLGGGLPEGSITLLLGPSGSGKTSLGLHFLSQASAGTPSMHFGFYETPGRLDVKARALHLDLARLVEADLLRFSWQPLVENLLDKLGHNLLEAVRRHDIKRLFIDGLIGFERAAVYKPRLIEFFAALTNELRALGVTTIAAWEIPERFGTDVSASGPDFASLFDNIVLLRQAEISGRHKRLLSIIKIRDGIFEPVTQEITFGNHGFEISLRAEPSENSGDSNARAPGL